MPLPGSYRQRSMGQDEAGAVLSKGMCHTMHALPAHRRLARLTENCEGSHQHACLENTLLHSRGVALMEPAHRDGAERQVRK